MGLALLALVRSLLGCCGGDGDGGGGGGGSAANGGTSGGAGSPRGLRGLRGDQLYDLLGAGMSVGVVLFLWNLNAGTLYFWMKARGWGVGGMRGGLGKARGWLSMSAAAPAMQPLAHVWASTAAGIA